MTLTLWKDNRLPLLEYTVTSNDLPVDLSSSTVKLQMRAVGSAALKVDTAGSVVNAVAGDVAYAWGASDTDTVGTYQAWFRVTTGGKDQDTPEFMIIIAEHAPISALAPAPVATDGTGTTTIYQGDSYLELYGRALHYQIQVQDAPDLTGATVNWRVTSMGFVKAMTVVGEDEVRVDLTSAETGAFTLGTKSFDIEAVVTSGETVTLLRATLNVLAAS